MICIRETLSDAWRGNLREVDECIFYIRQGLAGNRSVHLPSRIHHYLESLKRASNAAEKLLSEYEIDVYKHMGPRA